MTDALRKVRPGDPLVIPALAYNTFVDAARDFLARQQDQAAPLRSRLFARPFDFG
ncbi:MAG: hypothetical protein MUP47_08090 [Phycisphaerae bacterium]|nr:hypothetical protein [Phycisphaerae bacterium]